MAKPLNLLCVHGIGHQEVDPDFRESWTKAITFAVHSCDPKLDPSIDFLEYDDLFAHAPLDPATYGVAFAKLLASAVVHGIGDAVSRSRGLGDMPAAIRWTAGMVAQWSTEDGLRKATRERILRQMAAKS